MKKRICAALLLAAMLCTTAYAAPFADVSADDWYSEQVAYVYELGLMDGTSDTGFSPEVTLSRGMMLTILYRMEGKPAVSGTSFTDVAPGQWYSDAAVWAKQTGIAQGSGDGTLGHGDPLTREQMAVMLYRYARHKGYGMDVGVDLTAFADAAQISSWAKDAVAWAVEKGLLQGAGGKLLPAGTADRAQAAVVIARFCQTVWIKSETMDAKVGDIFYLVDSVPVAIVDGCDVHPAVCGGKSGTINFFVGAGSALTRGGFYRVTNRVNGHVSAAAPLPTYDVDYKAPGVLVYNGEYLTMSDDCVIFAITPSTGTVEVIAATEIADADTGLMADSDGHGYVTVLYVVRAEN